MIILGIDPGTASTGFAFVEISKKAPKILEAGVVSTAKDVDMHKRLKIIHNELTRLCKTHLPEEMVIERLFFNTNAKTAMTVGQARGVSLLVGAEFNMKIIEYTALQAKATLTGYGRADKKEVQNAVKKYFKLKDIIRPDDASDAVAMVACHLERIYIEIPKI